MTEPRPVVFLGRKVERTNELRIRGVTLQQCWQVSDFRNGVLHGSWREWRNVPEVPDDTPSKADTEEYLSDGAFHFQPRAD